MISDAIALIQFLAGLNKQRVILSAMFDSDGNRIAGSDKIRIRKHEVSNPNPNKPNFWFYSIDPYEDYIFVRMPVNPGPVAEEAGVDASTDTRDANFFRFVPSASGAVQGHPLANVRVNFLVYGYPPKLMLSLGESNS